MTDTYRVGCVIFDGYETLDIMGPIELLGMYPETFDLVMVAETKGPIASAQGPKCVVDETFADGGEFDILIVPGGDGTRREVDNEAMLDWLRSQAPGAAFVTSVCTGAALLARAGLLDGKQATTNKLAFAWVVSMGPQTEWITEARWVDDGRFLTSSGVSAGMDMTLSMIAKTLGTRAAEDAALWAEYTWHRDATNDPFAKAAGLV